MTTSGPRGRAIPPRRRAGLALERIAERALGLGGVYYENCDIAPTTADGSVDRQFGSKPNGVLPYAIDQDLAEQLWRVSNHLV